MNMRVKKIPRDSKKQPFNLDRDTKCKWPPLNDPRTYFAAICLLSTIVDT